MIQITGLDKLMESLGDLSQKTSDSKNNTPLNELFPCQFMLRYTDFPSIEHMLSKSGYNIRSQKDFNNLPAEQWNKFIAKYTRFNNWKEMLAAAGKEWVVRHLDFELTHYVRR